MRLERLLEAMGRERPDGVAIEAWSIFASESRALTLGIKDRQIGNAHVPLKLGDACGARYRLIWADGKFSRGYIERIAMETQPERALADARAAAYDDKDAACVLDPAPIPEVETYHAGTAELAGGDTSAIVPRLAAIRQRVADHGYRTWSGSFSATSGRSWLVTSTGMKAESHGTSTSWHVTINGEVGDGFSARAAESDAEFNERLDQLMVLAARLQETAEPRPGGTHPVILHPNVVESYVLDTLLDNLGGGTVAHGEGHFKREQFGSDRPVLREDLGLCLDPLQPLKCGSYAFTSEGVPAARCTFIERGRLTQPVLDVKYARRLGLRPTPLPMSADTLFLQGPTPLPMDEAMSRASGGALILSVLGTHTQDSASGDFSLSAPQALAIGPSGLAGRLRATISGNLFDTLSSDALRFVRFDHEHTPGLLFPCRLDPQ